MIRSFAPWIILVAVACTEPDKGSDKGPSDGASGTTGGTTPATTTSGGSSSSSGGATGTSTSSSTLTGDPIADVSWSLHEEIGAIVEVSWTQVRDGEVHVEFGDQLSSPTVTRAAGVQTELLLGIPYDSDFTFQIVSGDFSSPEVTGRTDPLPEGVPAPVLEDADSSAWGESDRWLLIGVGTEGEGWDVDTFWKLILDRDGRVVWAHETPMGYRTFYMQPSADGSAILWDENTFWTDWDQGKGSVVHRMTIDGTILETIALSGLHHTFLELEPGWLVWGGFDDGREVVRERSPDGEIRQIFDCTTYWEERGAGEACDGNGLFWNQGDDTLYFSSDAEHSVVELDRASGEVLHLWGQLSGAWPFSEGSTPFWKQHSPTRTPEGRLMVSTWTAQDDHEVLAREYEIDEANQTLREVWSCGQGSGIEADYAGEAHRLGSGNTLLNYGVGGHVREYTPDCAVAWHLRWPDQNLLGRGVFLDDLYALSP